MFGIYKYYTYICTLLTIYKFTEMKMILNNGRPQQHPRVDEWVKYV
jgi:hypothetical protein